ncbi:MAG: helix-hairpin-helix domain-containing protein, partial [Chloroflexi bacterium]|nr:helix-hairpin-helix domain-containing protein [Chloroflexota bacterium]
AADETDVDIFKRMDQLYTDWNLKRIYFVAFRPTKYTPLEEHPAGSLTREHRLYQMDWLKRVYKFTNQELQEAFDPGGFLPEDDDPKTAIALSKLDAFPMDVNTATKEDLLRVPGLGPTSAQRILTQRRAHKITLWRDLEAMGVVRKRAWAFLTFPGHKPPQSKQLRMELFQPRDAKPKLELAPAGPGVAPCGDVRSCTGCPMYGAPGHPGSPGVGSLPLSDGKAA